MKILHTADWHIGKKLHKFDLNEDFNLFISWLTALIKEHSIDLLLISGDIFDSSNPSSAARTTYYNALAQINATGVKTVITAGNHDSPAVLEAPAQILKNFSIFVVGSLPQNIEDCIFPFQKSSSDAVVIAAIPYLRDADLRHLSDTSSFEERLQALQSGIEDVFTTAANYCKDNYPSHFSIAMAHLYTAGIEPNEDSSPYSSDAERDIQIGNQAQFNANRFSTLFSYIAIGHIHKPQHITASTPTYYSGSPLPLSFSEKKDQKRVLLIDTLSSHYPQSIPVPSFRKLLSIKGSLQEITQKLASLSPQNLEETSPSQSEETSPSNIEKPEQTSLPSLLEIELLEDTYSPLLEDDFNALIASFTSPNYLIAKQKMSFKNTTATITQLYSPSENLSDLSPSDIFQKLLASTSLPPDNQQALSSAFALLLHSTLQHTLEE